MKKKTCVIFFNCHGGPIMKHLLTSKKFKNIYNIKYIPLYNYLDGYVYGNYNNLANEDSIIIKKCDLIILQYIKSERKVIHHDLIKNILKKDCKIILIPHYTFSGYFYNFDIINDMFINQNKTKNELNNYINQIHVNKKDNIIKNLQKELNNIKELDKLSDIKCYDFTIKFYKNKLLFHSRSYPSNYFFHHICNKIIQILNIKDKIKIVNNNYFSHTNDIIYPQVKKYLNLNFNIQFNFESNLIEYIICCKNNNVNVLYLKNRKKGKKHCNELLSIINSKKYR